MNKQDLTSTLRIHLSAHPVRRHRITGVNHQLADGPVAFMTGIGFRLLSRQDATYFDVSAEKVTGRRLEEGIAHVPQAPG